MCCRRMTTSLLLMIAMSRFVEAGPIIVAVDTAANPEYTDGWDDGENGGKGFGPWSLTFDGSATQLDPAYGGNTHFIDGANVGPMPAGGLTPRNFGMTTTQNHDRAAAQREFAEPLSVGRSLSMVIDGSAYEVGQFLGIGNKIQLLGADGIPRYELVSTDPAHTGFWTANGSNTSIPYDEPIRFTFSPNAGDAFSAGVSTLSPGIGHYSFNTPLGGTPGMPITGIRFENIGTGSSSDGATEMFFDDLQIVEYVPEPAFATLGALSLLALVGWCRKTPSGGRV